MRMLVLVVIALFAGCASQPESTQSSTPIVVAAATPAIAPAPAVPVEGAQPAQPATAFKAPPGYRMRKRGGETIYCRKDTILGSRFPEELCYTRDQLKDELRRAEEIRLNKSKVSGVCGGVQGACGNQ